MRGASSLQCFDPRGESLGSVRNKCEQRSVCWCFVLQPFVEYLFTIPRHFAQIKQTHHSTGTLKRVIATPYRDKRFVVVRVAAKKVKMLANSGHHFARLLEEYLQEFCIHLCGCSIDQLNSLRRRCFCRFVWCNFGDRRHHAGLVWVEGLLDSLQHFFTLPR